MEESEKSKKERLVALERITRAKNQKEIKELLTKIDGYSLALDQYIETLNTEVSFKISIKERDKED